MEAARKNRMKAVSHRQAVRFISAPFDICVNLSPRRVENLSCSSHIQAADLVGRLLQFYSDLFLVLFVFQIAHGKGCAESGDMSSRFAFDRHRDGNQTRGAVFVIHCKTRAAHLSDDSEDLLYGLRLESGPRFEIASL